MTTASSLSCFDQQIVEAISDSLFKYMVYHHCHRRSTKKEEQCPIHTNGNATDIVGTCDRFLSTLHPDIVQQIMNEIIYRRWSSCKSSDNTNIINSDSTKVADQAMSTECYNTRKESVLELHEFTSSMVNHLPSDELIFHIAKDMTIRKYQNMDLKCCCSLSDTENLLKDNTIATKNTSINKSTSISLFASHDGILDSFDNTFLTFDIIQERANNHIPIIIDMLLKIQYIDDIIPDIDDILQFLNTHMIQFILQILQSNSILSKEISAQSTISNDSRIDVQGTMDTHENRLSNTKSDDDPKYMIQKIIQIHCEWFTRTRTTPSNEYYTVQMVIIQNLVSMIQHLLTDTSISLTQSFPSEMDGPFDDKSFLHETKTTVHCKNASIYIIQNEGIKYYILHLLSMCCDMYDDVLHRENIYTNRRIHSMINDIGHHLWDWMCCDYHMQITIQRHCRYGYWVYMWFIQYLSMEQVLSLVLSPRSAIYLATCYNDAWIYVQSTIKYVFDNADSNNNDTINSTKYPCGMNDVLWIMSIYHSILVKTRTCNFPWDILCATTGNSSTMTSISCTKPNHDTSQSDTILDKLQEHFVTFIINILRWTCHDHIEQINTRENIGLGDTKQYELLDIDHTRSICIDCIEILLCGLSQNEQLTISIISTLKQFATTILDLDRNNCTVVNAKSFHHLIQKLLFRVHFEKSKNISMTIK